MPTTPYRTPALERVLEQLRQEYAGKLDDRQLVQVMRTARLQAEHLGISHRPRLVAQAIRDYLDGFPTATEPRGHRPPPQSGP
jgi:hypothetical protein